MKIRCASFDSSPPRTKCTSCQCINLICYRFLMKIYPDIKRGGPIHEFVQYLGADLTQKSCMTEEVALGCLLKAFQHRAARWAKWFNCKSSIWHSFLTTMESYMIVRSRLFNVLFWNSYRPHSLHFSILRTSFFKAILSLKKSPMQFSAFPWTYSYILFTSTHEH